MSAKVVNLIQSTEVRGRGTEADPSRVVTQYYTFEGELLFESDPYQETQIRDENAEAEPRPFGARV